MLPRLSAFFLPLACLGAPALAGSGPWVIGEGDDSLYVGLEGQRITRLAVSDGSGADSVMDVDEGLSTFGVKAILSYGLWDANELELGVPWYLVSANRTDGALCTALGEACDTTRGLGVITVRDKWLVLDELRGAPLSVAVGGEVRFGQLTARTRSRLTNLGEGTLDTGGFMSLGHTGTLGGQGFWSAYAEGAGRYRFPVTHEGERPIPGSEWGAGAELVVSPVYAVGFGPLGSWLHRPTGTDVEAADFSDPDWIGGLRVTKIAAGGAVHLRAQRRATVSLNVIHNVYAVNNPTDQLTVTAGMTLVDVLRSR